MAELFINCAGMLLLGVGVGLISGSLGLGGGVIMVPAFLTFVPGMDPHTAKGTSLCIIVFVALLNAWRLNRGLAHKPWRLAGLLAAGSIAGGYTGAWVTAQLPEQAVLWLFMALVAVFGVRTFFLQPPEVDAAQVRRRFLLPLCIGFAAGVVGGATGTGGGAVLVPLTLFAALTVNARVTGLSNMVMVATSLAGTLAHLRAEPVFPGQWVVGHVYLYVVPFVFAGAQIGSPVGTRLNARLTLSRRRVVLGALLLLIAARILYRLLFLS